MMTKKKLENCLYQAVEIEDCDGIYNCGWLVKRNNEYVLLPLHTIWNIYFYKVSHIKSVRFLSNNHIIK